MERKKYYIVMFCVISVSEAVQASYGTFSQSDQKRLDALEKKVQRLNEQFQAHCLAQERAQTHNLRQIQTQARAALNQQQAIQGLQQASLAHEESKQAMQADIEELQECVLQLEDATREDLATLQESVAALRNMVHLLIAQTVDDIRRHQDALYEPQQSSRRSVVLMPRQRGQRSSLHRVPTSDALHEQDGGWFVSDSEGD